MCELIKETKKKRGQRLGIVATAGQAAQLLPAPGGKQHLNQQDHRDADKHQLPVTRHFVLVRVNHQFPDDGVEMQVETGEHFAVDQQQRHARRRKDGGQEAHQTLRHDDKRQREEDQQIGGEHQKAEMPDHAELRIDTPGEGSWPVGDKQITAANDRWPTEC